MDQFVFRWLRDLEVTVSADYTVQIDAAVGSNDEGSRCSVGVEPVVVLPVLVWPAAGVHLHTWKR